MARGGKREGAGRKVGSTVRPQLRDYYSEDEIKAIVTDLKKRAKKDDVLFKVQLEQIFGKAPQSIALSNPDGTNLFGDEETKNKTKKTVGSFLKGDSTAGDRKDT